MTDLFTLLALRAVSEEAVPQPRPRARFEPANAESAPLEDPDDEGPAPPRRVAAEDPVQPQSLTPVETIREIREVTRPGPAQKGAAEDFRDEAPRAAPLEPPVETPQPAPVEPRPPSKENVEARGDESAPEPDDHPTTSLRSDREQAPEPTSPPRKTKSFTTAKPVPSARPEESKPRQQSVTEIVMPRIVAKPQPVELGREPSTRRPAPAASLEPRPDVGTNTDRGAERAFDEVDAVRPEPHDQPISPPNDIVAEPPARADSGKTPETVVHVSIGRLEVRAETGSTRRKIEPRRPSPVLTLDEYLRRRSSR